MLKTNQISFGGTAAVVTSTALICGLTVAHASRPIIISALLIAAIADNLTDALSIHIFQESEHVNQRSVYIGTLSNFVARLLLSASFLPLIELFPPSQLITLSIVWGMSLLAILSFLVARDRKVKPLPEIAKHFIAAAAVILASILIPPWINSLLA